jgi:hypothetical protein
MPCNETPQRKEISMKPKPRKEDFGNGIYIIWKI